MVAASAALTQAAFQNHNTRVQTTLPATGFDRARLLCRPAAEPLTLSASTSYFGCPFMSSSSTRSSEKLPGFWRGPYSWKVVRKCRTIACAGTNTNMLLPRKPSPSVGLGTSA